MNPKIFSDCLSAFANELLRKSGVDLKESTVIARVLVWNDMIGRYTQGIWRLPAYLKTFNLSLINLSCNSSFIQKFVVI